MRPVSVFANDPGSETGQLQAGLHGRRREAAQAVVVLLLSLHGLAASQIAVPLGCHPPTVRRWTNRFSDEGWWGWLTDRGQQRRSRLGGRRLTGRIAALLARPARGLFPGSGGTRAGRRSARGRCTGGSGWWRSGADRS